MKYISGFILFLFFNISCGQNAEPEKYYIPHDFRGKVSIVFGVKNGTKAKYESGTRIYNINKHGVLLTQFTSNEGFHSDILNQVCFYLVSETDTLKLPVVYGSETFNDSLEIDSVRIFTIHNGTSGNYSFKSFYVDSFASVKNYPESNFFEDGEKWDSLYHKYGLK